MNNIGICLSFHQCILGGLFGGDPRYLDSSLRCHFGFSNVVSGVSAANAEEYDALVFMYFWMDKKTGEIGGHYFTATRNQDNTFTLHNEGNNETMIANNIWVYLKNDKAYGNTAPMVWGVIFSD